MTLNEYYRQIHPSILYQYLHEIQQDNTVDFSKLCMDISNKTGVPLDLIQRDVKENLLREAARRWVKDYKSQFQKDKYVKCGSCNEVIAYSIEYFKRLKEAFGMGAGRWRCPVCGEVDNLDDVLKRKVEDE